MSSLKKAVAAVSIISSFFAPLPVRAESMTLASAIEIAMSESPRAAASSAAKEAAEGGVTESTGLLTPGVTVSERFLRSDDPVAVFAGKLQQGRFTAGDFALPSLNNPGGINDWVTRFEVAQPVFHSGTDWAQRRSAKEQASARGSMEAFDRARIRLAVTNLYYTAVSLARQHAAMQEGIRKLRALESSYQLMEAPTSASTTSYLVARSVRTNLEAEALKIECQRGKALRDLNAILGRDPNSELSLSDALPPVARQGKGTEEASMRSDVEASRASARAAAAMRDAAVRRWGPNVDFFGAYSIHTGNFESSKGMYEVGARLSWPLLDIGRHGAIQRTKAEMKRAQEESRAAELEAAADLATAEANLSSCIERYGIVGSAAETAAEAMNIATTRYDEGTLPLMDYSQTIQNWVEMRVRFIESHLNATIARAMGGFHRNAI